MEEQPVIFDESFEAAFNERRRNIMPLGLKIYAWIGMVIGAMFTIIPFISLIGPGNDGVAVSYRLTTVAVTVPFGVMIFMMTFLLWKEVKWAIRFNWVVGIVWAIPVIFAFAVNGAEAVRYLLSFLLFAPYWIWLYRIQERWEKMAVSGKQFKAATLK